MFNLGAGEIAVIMIVALLLLGPDKLPELARGIGKFMREFRRQTDEVRGVVEREFYKMDAELQKEPQIQVRPAQLIQFLQNNFEFIVARPTRFNSVRLDSRGCRG